MQDRHRRPVAHNVGDAGKSVEEMIPVNLELHDVPRIEGGQGVRQLRNTHNPTRCVLNYPSYINTSSTSRSRNPVHRYTRPWRTTHMRLVNLCAETVNNSMLVHTIPGTPFTHGVFTPWTPAHHRLLELGLSRSF